MSVVESYFARLDGANEWLNSQPLGPAELRGKVVLVDFWTFTCINWLRTLPYLREWADKYESQGLVVIGVHTPEFGFEHDLDNVRAAIKAMGIEYPVAIDNDYAIWRAFDNQYWPALYFLDGEGSVRDKHFGEGRYDESERSVQRLLKANGAEGVSDELVSLDPDGIEAAADWDTLRTPETYVGYLRAEGFASPGGLVPEERRVYELPGHLGLNDWGLSGDWTVKGQPATVNEPGGRIAERFQARDLNLVMRPGTRGTTVRFRVSLDGQPPGAAHGLDVDEQGEGVVSDERCYQLIRQPGQVDQHTFEIEFQDAGAQAFVFTFG